MVDMSAAMPSGCNGKPRHAYTTQRGPKSPIWVRKCSLCGEIDWQDLINEIAELTAAAGVDEVVIRSQERAACEQEIRAWRERAETAERDREQQRLAYNAANAMAGVHKLRADRLKAELEHAKGALAGDSEAMAAFMADHARVVERLREQNRIAHRAAEQAEAALDRVHALAEQWSHEPHPTHDHPCPDDLRRELLAALDSQSPTLEAETPAGEDE